MNIHIHTHKYMNIQIWCYSGTFKIANLPLSILFLSVILICRCTFIHLEARNTCLRNRLPLYFLLMHVAGHCLCLCYRKFPLETAVRILWEGFQNMVTLILLQLLVATVWYLSPKLVPRLLWCSLKLISCCWICHSVITLARDPSKCVLMPSLNEVLMSLWIVSVVLMISRVVTLSSWPILPALHVSSAPFITAYTPPLHHLWLFYTLSRVHFAPTLCIKK